MGEFVSLAQVLEKIVFGNWELGIGNRASGIGHWAQVVGSP